MTTPNNLSLTAENIRPTIETIAQAAGEITRLYTVFDKIAVDLTPDYLQGRLAGEEGVTWAMFPWGAFDRPTPILDEVVRRGGSILLGAGYTIHNELLREYDLARNSIFLPGPEGTFVKTGAVTICRPKKDFDPGDEYLAADGKVLRAEYDHHRSVPTVGEHGGLVWSSPREWISDRFREETGVDPSLWRVIERLRTYEPVADQPPI